MTNTCIVVDATMIILCLPRTEVIDCQVCYVYGRLWVTEKNDYSSLLNVLKVGQNKKILNKNDQYVLNLTSYSVYKTEHVQG